MELYEDQAQMFDLSMRQYAEYMKLLEAIEEKKAKTMRGQQRAEVRAKLITALTDGLEYDRATDKSIPETYDIKETVERLEAQLFQKHKDVTKGYMAHYRILALGLRETSSSRLRYEILTEGIPLNILLSMNADTLMNEDLFLQQLAEGLIEAVSEPASESLVVNSAPGVVKKSRKLVSQLDDKIVNDVYSWIGSITFPLHQVIPTLPLKGYLINGHPVKDAPTSFRFSTRVHLNALLQYLPRISSSKSRLSTVMGLFPVEGDEKQEYELNKIYDDLYEFLTRNNRALAFSEGGSQDVKTVAPEEYKEIYVVPVSFEKLPEFAKTTPDTEFSYAMYKRRRKNGLALVLIFKKITPTEEVESTIFEDDNMMEDENITIPQPTTTTDNYTEANIGYQADHQPDPTKFLQEDIPLRQTTLAPNEVLGYPSSSMHPHTSYPNELHMQAGHPHHVLPQVSPQHGYPPGNAMPGQPLSPLAPVGTGYSSHLGNPPLAHPTPTAQPTQSYGYPNQPAHSQPLGVPPGPPGYPTHPAHPSSGYPTNPGHSIPGYPPPSHPMSPGYPVQVRPPHIGQPGFPPMPYPKPPLPAWNPFTGAPNYQMPQIGMPGRPYPPPHGMTHY